MFGCPLKSILGYYGIFCIYGIKLKYSYTIMYDCEKSPLTHELFYIGFFKKIHSNLFNVNGIFKEYI
jgi:hypothetical protein